jgi:hypothetical protein
MIRYAFPGWPPRDGKHIFQRPDSFPNTSICPLPGFDRRFGGANPVSQRNFSIFVA